MSRRRQCRVLDLTDSYDVSDDTGGDDDYDPYGSSKKKANRTNSSKARKGSYAKISKSTPSVKKSPVKKTAKPAILLPPTRPRGRPPTRNLAVIPEPQSVPVPEQNSSKPKLGRPKKVRVQVQPDSNLVRTDNGGDDDRKLTSVYNAKDRNANHNRNPKESKDGRLETQRSEQLTMSTPVANPKQKQSSKSIPSLSVSRTLFTSQGRQHATPNQGSSKTPVAIQPETETETRPPEIIVFTSGSEDEELVRDHRPIKKPKTAVRKPKPKPTLFQPKLQSSGTETETTTTGIDRGSSTISFWRKVLANTNTTATSSKRKLSSGNNDSNKRSKQEAENTPSGRGSSKSFRTESAPMMDDSEDEDDQRFMSIFKKPVSLKSSKSILELNMSLSMVGSGSDDEDSLEAEPEAPSVRLVTKENRTKQAQNSKIGHAMERHSSRALQVAKSFPKPSVNLRRIEMEQELGPDAIRSISNALDVGQVQPNLVKPIPTRQTQCASTSTAFTATGDVASTETPEPVGRELKTDSRHPSKIKAHNRSQTVQIEARDQSSGTDLKTTHDRETEIDHTFGPTLMDIETNTISVELRHQGLDPIIPDTMDKHCETDTPEQEYKSTQTDAEWQATTSASTSNSVRVLGTQTNSRVLQIDSRIREASPDPELRGTELTLGNGGSSHIGQLIHERINEDIVYAQIDEDLPSFYRLTNSDLQNDEMTFSVSETLKEIYSISPREVEAEEWEEVYPNVRMCAFNPNPNAATTKRQMIGYINIEARTLRPFEESADMGPTLFICLEGPVVFKTNQFSTNARGEQFLSPITVQSGGSILIGRGVPHSIENRSNNLAKLAYFVFNVGE